jgi:hypothetical protein
MLRIWKPDFSSTPGRSVADRIAWTVFALGIGLMVSMVLYSTAHESDGRFRSWETIRLHERLFLSIALIPVAGPLIVFLCQAARLLDKDEDFDSDELASLLGEIEESDSDEE